VGKQRLAIWTAAALNCGGGSARPCGACVSCRLAARLQHPDIHWFFPTPRPKRAAGPEQLAQKLEETRAAVLEERRANPLYLEDEGEVTGIFVGSVQTMRRHAHVAPAMGPHKAIVIGHAEALVPQAGNPEAANALLKLLEEPPADTSIILTSDAPGALLPTVRSRLQPVRVPPLTNERVAEFLQLELGLNATEAAHLAALSGGSIGRALDLRDEDRDSLQQQAAELVRAMLDGRLSTRLAVAHHYGSSGARGAFAQILAEARSILRDILAVSADAAHAAHDPRAATALTRTRPADPALIIRALQALDDAVTLTEKNINPQLIVLNLLGRVSAGDDDFAGAAAGRGGSLRDA
jgi:DNA polymerase-3 subunit delta'